MFAARISVYLTADIFNFARDIGGAAASRSLERHMFEQMGDAVDVARFVPRPGTDPHADRRRFNRFNGIGDDPHTVRQSGRPDAAHAAPGRLT